MHNFSAHSTKYMKVRTKSVGKRRRSVSLVLPRVVSNHSDMLRFFFQFNLHTQASFFIRGTGPVSYSTLIILQACVGLLSEDACSQQTTLSAQSSRLRRTIKTISARCFHVKYPCPTEIFVHSCLSSASSASCSTPPASSQSSQSSSIIQSPPSSRASVSALATPTLAPVRPQPRIQVSSLLADSNTRYELLAPPYPSVR